MALDFRTVTRGDVAIVYLSGAILFGEESASLRSLVRDLLNQSNQIVLDLKEVSYVDSGGLGTLVALYASARKVGGEIKLSRLGRRANEVLQITKLMTIFDVFDDVDAATASFAQAPLKQKSAKGPGA
jgi:anti-sigma B factor antagonist